MFWKSMNPLKILHEIWGLIAKNALIHKVTEMELEKVPQT